MYMLLMLPAYASDLSSKTQGDLILALKMSLRSSDSSALVIFPIMLTSTYYCSDLPCPGVVAFLLWGFSKGFGQYLAFGPLYGLVAGGYIVRHCRFVTALPDVGISAASF